MEFIKGTLHDLDELEELYRDTIDDLDAHINYPGWKKDIYPDRETAKEGIEEGHLYVLKDNGHIVGSVILRHVPEEAYEKADWKCDLDYQNIIVVYTLLVHPDARHKKAADILMDAIITYARRLHMKAIRLDVTQGNTPAIHLYQRHGFDYIDTIDLGYGEYGLDAFALYQLLL